MKKESNKDKEIYKIKSNINKNIKTIRKGERALEKALKLLEVLNNNNNK